MLTNHKTLCCFRLHFLGSLWRWEKLWVTVDHVGGECFQAYTTTHPYIYLQKQEHHRGYSYALHIQDKERWQNLSSMLNASLSQLRACLLCDDLWAAKCQETQAFICCYWDDYPDRDETSEDNPAKCATGKGSALIQTFHLVYCITFSFPMQFWKAICVPHVTLKASPHVEAWKPFI